MTAQRFFAELTGSEDDLRLVAEALKATGKSFCLIGGLAVNHYVEPVVTLDADFAISASAGVTEALKARGFIVQEHTESLNATLKGSRLRVQIALNERYGSFPSRAVHAEIFGVELPVAALPDLIQGKLWALADPKRGASKKLKDKSDLVRICESHPDMMRQIPAGVISEVDAMRNG